MQKSRAAAAPPGCRPASRQAGASCTPVLPPPRLYCTRPPAGLVLGVQGGGGFVITRLSGGKWSAPCYVKVTAAQAGAIIGFEKASGRPWARGGKNEWGSRRVPMLCCAVLCTLCLG